MISVLENRRNLNKAGAASFLVASLCLGGMAMVHAAPTQTGAGVCGDPQRPCTSAHKSFAPYDLSFQIPKKIKPNTPYSSRTFYAVVLRVYPLTNEDICDGGEFSTAIERERKAAQKLFPRNKAFASYQCPDMGALGYVIDGKSKTSTFLAVYGGTTGAQAKTVLAKARKRYSRAAIRSMRVVFEQIMQ